MILLWTVLEIRVLKTGLGESVSDSLPGGWDLTSFEEDRPERLSPSLTQLPRGYDFTFLSSQRAASGGAVLRVEFTREVQGH